MDQAINAMVSAIMTVVTSGVALVVFAVLWIAFVAAIIWSQGSLDSAWNWIRELPLVVQGIVWILFLPVTAGLWVWETTWPLVLRLIIVAGLAGWSILMFIPRAAAANP